MKKIAITQRLVANESHSEIREALDVQWGKLFLEMGFLPIVLPSEVDFKYYFEVFEIGGILLTGGNDLNTLNANPLSERRDLLEKDLIAYAVEQEIPLFGVCRGAQVIAEYFGARFKQVKDQVATRHPLHARETSKFFTYLDKIDEVNSYHNYAIESVADELIISATNGKGLIKAIEHKEHRIFAQMWHSERETPFSRNEMELIKVFFSGGKNE